MPSGPICWSGCGRAWRGSSWRRCRPRRRHRAAPQAGLWHDPGGRSVHPLRGDAGAAACEFEAQAVAMEGAALAQVAERLDALAGDPRAVRSRRQGLPLRLRQVRRGGRPELGGHPEASSAYLVSDAWRGSSPRSRSAPRSSGCSTCDHGRQLAELAPCLPQCRRRDRPLCGARRAHHRGDPHGRAQLARRTVRERVPPHRWMIEGAAEAAAAPPSFTGSPPRAAAPASSGSWSTACRTPGLPFSTGCSSAAAWPPSRRRRCAASS